MNATFQKLVNIAKRIHHTEASRSQILEDLASISEKEYEELEKHCLIEKSLVEPTVAGYIVKHQIHDWVKIGEIKYSIELVGGEYKLVSID